MSWRDQATSVPQSTQQTMSWREQATLIPEPQGTLGAMAQTGKDIGSGLLKMAGEKYQQYVDPYTGAPIRAGIYQLQENAGDPGKAWDAAKTQFGGDASKAPTGKDIAKRAGVPDTSLSDVIPSAYDNDPKSWKLQRGGLLDPTASGAAGMGIDMAADPLNVVPLSEVARLAGRGAEAIGDIGKAAKNAKEIYDPFTKTTRAVEGSAEGLIRGEDLSSAAKGAESATKEVYDPFTKTTKTVENADSAQKLGGRVADPSKSLGETVGAARDKVMQVASNIKDKASAIGNSKIVKEGGKLIGLGGAFSHSPVGIGVGLLAQPEVRDELANAGKYVLKNPDTFVNPQARAVADQLAQPQQTPVQNWRSRAQPVGQ